MSENGYESDSRDRNRSRSPLSDRKRERKHSPIRSAKRSSASDRRIFVNNIPYECSWQDIKDLFREAVGEVAFVEVFSDDNKRSKGCAVVEFTSARDAEAAVEKMDGYELKTRPLMVKMDREPPPRRSRRSRRDMTPPRQSLSSGNQYGETYGLSVKFLESLGIKGPLVNRIFVSNVHYKADEEMLKDVFKIAGRVVDITIMKDTEGKNRGFAVVEYEHPVQAVQAISMLHNQIYYDKRLLVRLDRDAEKKDVTSKLPPGLRGVGLGLGPDGKPIIDVTGIPPQSSPSNPPMPMNYNVPNMGGNFGNNFGNYGGMMGMSGGMDAMSAMPNISTNMPSMFGTNPGMTAQNIGNPNPVIGGNDQMRMSFNAMNVPSNSMNLARTGNFSSSLDGNVPFRDVGRMDSSDSSRTTTEIGNLPYDYSWQKLRDLCRPYGDIKFADMTGRGVGIVRFQSEADARRCAELLDGLRFEGRVLDARLL